MLAHLLPPPTNLRTLTERCSLLNVDITQLDDLVKRPDLVFELYTIPFSHYNERARWALTYAGIQYSERKYLPVFHMLPMWLLSQKFQVAGRRDNTASTTHPTPALAIYDTSGVPLLCISDSSLICRFASAYAVHRGGRSLYHVPINSKQTTNDSIWAEDADIVALEQVFHDKLGVSARSVAYSHYLPSFKAFAATDWNSVGWLQAVCHILLYPLIAWLIWSGFKLSEKTRVQRHTDTVEAQLQLGAATKTANHTRYLCRDVFTAADVTFASLAAVTLAISPAEGYGSYFPPPTLVGQAYAELTVKLRASPGGQCVLDIYKCRKEVSKTSK